MGKRGQSKRAAASRQQASVTAKKNREGVAVPELEDRIKLTKADAENADLTYDPSKERLTIGKGRNAITIQPAGERVEKSAPDGENLVEAMKKLKILDGFFNDGASIRELYAEAINVEADVKDGLLRPKVDEKNRPTTFPTEEAVVRVQKRAHVASLNFVEFFAETGLLSESVDEGYRPQTVLVSAVTKLDRGEAVSDVVATLRYSATGEEVCKDDYWFTAKMGNVTLASTPSEAYYAFGSLLKNRSSKRTGIYLGREKSDAELEAEAKRKAKAKKQFEKDLAKAKAEDPPTQEEEDVLKDNEQNIRPRLLNVESGRTTLVPYPFAILKECGTNPMWLELYWKEGLDHARPVYVDLTWNEYYFYGSLRERFVQHRLQWFYMEYSYDHLNDDGEWELKNFVLETKANASRVEPGTWGILKHKARLAQLEEKERNKREREERQRQRRVRFDEEMKKPVEDPDALDTESDPALEREGESSGDAETMLRNMVREQSMKQTKK